MTSNQILSLLPPYAGKKDILIYNQDVDDIIKGIVKAQTDYASHYNQIWPYFDGGDYKSTARNVWNFLKKNSDYVVEPDSRQTIKTPAAILATAKKQYGGNDCKNYALFSAGVLRAYRDATGEDFNLYFRFAGYSNNGLAHVFTVIEKDGKEIWVDAVLDSFNNREHEPTETKDIKIKKMALIALSGVNPYENKKSFFSQENPVPGQYMGKFDIQSITNFSNQLQASPAGANPYVAAGSALVSTLTSLFASTPNPNDWMGWEALDRGAQQPVGTQAANWALTDGDSIKNEALNIVEWIKSKGIDTVLADNFAIKAKFGRNATLSDITDKLTRGGYPEEARQFAASFNQSGILPGGSTTKAGTNMLITLALVGAAAFLLLKKR